MRIVIAGQTYYPASNGQAVFTVHLAEGLAGAGHEVMAVVPSYQRAPYTAWLNGVRIEAMRSRQLAPSLPEVFVSFPTGRLIGRMFDGFEPDIVHIQDHYPLCRAIVAAARRRGIAVMGTNHFLPENVIHYLKLPGWTRSALEKLAWLTMLELYNRLDIVTTPTETAAGILRRQRIRPPVYPVSCGVDMDRFHPDPTLDRAALRRRYGLDPQRTLFLFVGRVDQEKRIDVLLRAVKRLERDDVQVAIAGRGNYAAVLQAQLQQLQLGDRAVFTGYVPPEDLPGLLNSADVFVMPSEAELQSIATLEAMASGKPILAANARALPELVEPGVNGYLFRPGDVEDAARWMLRLMEQRQDWPALGAASLARVRRHGLNNTILRYEEIYNRLKPALLPMVALHTTQHAGVPR